MNKKYKMNFTAVELMTVIVIMGVIIGIAGPNVMKSYQDYQLRGIADNLVSDLTYMRNLSITKSIYIDAATNTKLLVKYGIRFRMDTYQTFIYKSDNSDLTAFDVEKPYSDRFDGTIDISGTQIMPNTDIIFDNLGRPIMESVTFDLDEKTVLNKIALTLTSTNNVLLLATTSNDIKVIISPVTGKAKVEL